LAAVRRRAESPDGGGLGGRALAARSIAVHVAETRDAVKLYNELTDIDAVGGLFHSTC
jgi:hypothetical protein